MRLMSSDSAWAISRKKPTGTISRAGQMMRPPALVETSCRSYASTNNGHDSHMTSIAIGSRKNERAEDVDPRPGRARKVARR